MNHFLDIREQSGMEYQILFRVESNLKFINYSGILILMLHTKVDCR